MKDTLWELGEQITVRIEGDRVLVGNGIEILAVFDCGPGGVLSAVTTDSI